MSLIWDVVNDGCGAVKAQDGGRVVRLPRVDDASAGLSGRLREGYAMTHLYDVLTVNDMLQ